ncbi:MAG: cupin domain-containing protein [Elusimicrobia bacterium]|nr:cupin domain-containing protein [Elusimicrobiota bacterium]
MYKVTKPWGYELWINNEHPGYSLKKVSIRAGHRTSLQYHLHKHETNVIFSGAAAIHYNRRPDIPPGEAPLEAIGTVRIDPVTSVEVSPGTLHRVEALTDISLYETSTPHLDDVIRVHDDAARRNGRIPGEHGGKV